MLLLLMQDNSVREEEALCSQDDQYFRAEENLPDTFFFLRSQTTSPARRPLIWPDGESSVGPAFLHKRPWTQCVEQSRELIHLLLSSFPLRLSPALQSNEVAARRTCERASAYEREMFH